DRVRELAFGELELHVWATAISRPAFQGDTSSSPGNQPYGVAELFRQCLESAADFRRRCRRAGRWLQGTVVGALALLALMFGLTAVFFANRPDPMVTAMENELQLVLPGARAKSADRLKEPLKPKLDKLQLVKSNPDFDKLPASLRARVDDYMDEIRAYQQFEKEFNATVPAPKEADSDSMLD